MPLRGRFAPTVAASILAPLLFAAAALADDWPAYQHDASHTGRSSASFDPRDLQLGWSAPRGYATPVVVGDTVIATRNGNYGNAGAPPAPAVSAFDLRTGALKWTYDAVTPVSQAAVGGGLVVFRGAVPGNPVTLQVLDAATGTPKYTVNAPADALEGMPTVYREPNGDVRAYYASANRIVAVDLGTTGGSVRWSYDTLGVFGNSNSIATVGGRSVFITSPGHALAFDRDTGAVNHFYSGGISGGGGTTPAFDAGRNRLYVSDSLTPTASGVIAFDYANNGAITERWRYTGNGTSTSASVAIGPDGKVYSAGSYIGGSDLVALDPDTGVVARRATASGAGFSGTPMVNDGFVWTINNPQTRAYDAATLAPVATFPGARNGDSPFDSPGAIFDDGAGLRGFLLDYGNVGEPRNGFAAYFVVPEPGSTALLATALLLLPRPHRRRARM